MARDSKADQQDRPGIVVDRARWTIGRLLASPRSRRCAGGALLLCVAGSIALDALAQEPRTLRLSERVLSPEIRSERAAVLRATPVDGRVVLDPAKIGAAHEARAATHVAADLAGNSVLVTKLPDGTIALDQLPNQWVVVTPETPTVLAMREGVQWLPGVCVKPSDEPGTNAPDIISSYIQFSTVPVAWDTATDAYRIRADVGLVRNGDPTLGGELGKSAAVKLSFRAVTGTIEPSEVSLDRLAVEGEKGVQLSFTRTDAPDPLLIVRSTLAGEQPFTLDVRPRLDLRPAANPILGLGLEETDVSIEVVQAHGAHLRLGETVVARIQCEGARKKGDDDVQLVDGAPPARFVVNSSWLGGAHIVATTRSSTQEIVGSVTIEQEMPWAQLAAALLGGALGGYSRRFKKGSRRTDARKRVIEGVIVGLVAFIAGAIGVGYLSFPRGIVALVPGALLTGVLAGFVGVTVIEEMTKRFTRGKPANPPAAPPA